MQNSYLALNHARRHPLLAGLEDAPRIINGTQRVRVRPRAEFPSPVTLIPSYPDLPMEHVFPRGPATDERQVYLRDLGRSRVVYFPGDLDRTFWDVLAADHGRLLANAVDWAAGEERPVTVTGPGLLDVTVWRQKESLTVHLVNFTNPMAMKGPVPRVRAGRSAAPSACGCRRAARPAASSSWRPARHRPRPRRPACSTVTVPSVLDHEVVAVDL